MFPEFLFVSHFDHSSEESPSLNACLQEADAIEEGGPTPVAEYKLVRVRNLKKTVEEVVLIVPAPPNPSEVKDGK